MAESRRRQNLRCKRCPNYRERGHVASKCTATVFQPSSSTTFASVCSVSFAQTTSLFTSSSIFVSSIFVHLPLSKAHELNETSEFFGLINVTSTVSKNPPLKKLDT